MKGDTKMNETTIDTIIYDEMIRELDIEIDDLKAKYEAQLPMDENALCYWHGLIGGMLKAKETVERAKELYILKYWK